jgi:hypothetical protein
MENLKTSQFYVTSSEFSDIGKLIEVRDLSSANQNNLEVDLKVAKFKQIDWNAIEGKLIPKTTRVLRNNRHQSVDHRPQKADPSFFNEFFPKLRKSLRGMQPDELHGRIWP